MGKNVAVFVDVANIFYAAKAAGVDIDYVTLLKSATAGRDFVRAYAYTGLDPDNENQRNFHQFLARHQYKVILRNDQVIAASTRPKIDKATAMYHFKDAAGRPVSISAYHIREIEIR